MTNAPATPVVPGPGTSRAGLEAAAVDGPLLARDVMTSNLLTVAADDGLLLTWELMTQAGVHHVPVLDGSRCIGLVDASIIAMECVRDPLGRHHRLIGEAVPATTIRVSDDTPVEVIARQLLATRDTAVLVSNAAGQLVGLITVHDLLRVLAKDTPPRPDSEPVITTATLFRLTPVLPCVVDVPEPPQTTE
jgi:CBS domain-containing protein